MWGRGRAPEWTDPEMGAFRPRDGDTVPGAILTPGILPGFYDVPPTSYDVPPGSYDVPPRSYGVPPGSRDVPPTYARRPRRRLGRVIRRAVIMLGVFVLLAAIAFGALLAMTPSASQAQTLARAQAQAHGTAVPGPPVSDRFAEALVATEDHRFYSDPGVDPIAVGRVAIGYLTGSGPQQGGATITQQLAKMLYTPGRSGFSAEAEQIALAVKLNFTYSKPQILQMYADVAYFGQNYYGLGTASCGYFGVPPGQLTWPQAALLAGAVQGPSLYDPLTNPAQAHAREAHVLGRLVATGTLTQAQADAALGQSLHLGQSRMPPPAGSDTCGAPRA
ncbi:MAG TPA: biosynthetic peptidoglycan transglycosylase [Streptosporangiaceae bacterium]